MAFILGQRGRRGARPPLADPDVTIATLTVLILVGLVLAGCAKPSAARTTGAAQVATSIPLRGVLLVDQTSSMVKAWEDTLQTDDVRAAAEPVAERGGDLLVLFVRHNSRSTPAITFHADPPLPRPASAAGTGDVYDAADAAERQRRLLTGWEEKERRRIAGVELELARFIPAVDQLLQAKSDTKGTDLASGLLRADAFFREPDVPGQPSPDRVLIALSDGQENMGLTSITRLSIPVTVLVVNSSGKPGVFAVVSDRPVHFVSVRSAIRYMRGGAR